MGHVAQHVVHLRVGQATAVGRGVEQAEQHVGAGAGALGAQGGVEASDLGGPDVDVGALQGSHPLAGAAGLATLRLATDEVYAHVDRVSAALQTEVHAALSAAGVPHVIQAAGNLFSVFFVSGVDSVPDYATASGQSTTAYSAFFHAMLDQGVYLPPSAYEGWFLSSAHDDGAMDRIVTALPAAARIAASLPTR